MHLLYTQSWVNPSHSATEDPVKSDTWMAGFGKELGHMAQGDDKTGTTGIDCIFVMSHSEIANIPADRLITYARSVVDFRSKRKTTTKYA